ncbi:hypothetical protein A0J61_01059 [Choanephora cucurbitarum]|uniref:Uncharacterized protein n=1 Tax=Choanephora cucurbitarum TaxID=101091 RepID=A0A1C7NP48_9FUNG|nr:hypothetical protein A0J61_01059 [Choanephora cucurbitarum]
MLAKRFAPRAPIYRNLCISRSIQTNTLKRPIKGTRSTPLHIITYQRHFSIWTLPAKLLTASPLQRKLALVGLGGFGLATMVVLGPFIMVGLGGLTAFGAFRLWRLRQQLQQVNQQDWPNYILQQLAQQQEPFRAGLFGQGQRHVQSEALRRFNTWAHTEQGHAQLIDLGIYPDHISQNVSMRGSSSRSFSAPGQHKTEIKIELDMRNAPGVVLVAKAILEKESNELQMKEIQLVTASGYILSIPLSAEQHQSQNGGRIIEGEFRDV